MAKTLGLVSLVWRGVSITVEKGSKVKLGGLIQKPVITGQQVNSADEFVASEITATTVLAVGTSLLTLFAPGQGELDVICDTGQTYSFPDAFLVDPPSFTAGDGGKVPLKWSAGAPNELIASA